MRSLMSSFFFHWPLPWVAPIESMTPLTLGVEFFAEFVGAELDARLDQGGVLFHGEVRVGFEVAEDPAFALGDDLVAELLRRDFVAPLAEGALGELLDVALVHQGHGLAAVLERVRDGVAHQALGAEDRDGLDADARVFANLLLAALEHVVVEEVDELLALRGFPA